MSGATKVVWVAQMTLFFPYIDVRPVVVKDVKGIGDWRLEINGNWRLETGNWGLFT